MTPQEFINKLNAIKQTLEDKAPHIIGQEYVNQANKAFQDEGFTDKNLNKWEPRKKDTGRKILTGKTAELGSATEYKVNGNIITISNDKPYAQAHNEGTKNAGRGNKTQLPKRTFIAQSEDANKRIAEAITLLVKS